MDEFSQADVVLQALIELGLVEDSTSEDWSGFVGSEPDGPEVPDNVITIFDTGGRVFPRSTPDSHRIEYPGVQVRIRSGLYTEGYTKARNIALALDGINYEIVEVEDNEYLIHTISRSTEVLSIGKESPTSKRSLFTINAMISYRKLP